MIGRILGFSANHNQQHDKIADKEVDVGSKRRRQVGRAIVALSGSLFIKGNALASVPLDAISDQNIMERLKAPTSDQPKVPLPTQGTKANTLEGKKSDG